MRREAVFVILLLFACLMPWPAPAADDSIYAARRAAMVEEIAAGVRETSERIGRGTLNPRVLEAMRTVPRHEMVPERERGNAYENRPLPIGYGQTISQPYIVAIMTDLLYPQKDDVVLEVGTGSGYQAAVLAQCVKEVYTMEIVKELGDSARERLKRLGYTDVEVRVGDGYHGWREHGPYDGIVVTAASSHIPPPLIAQLKPGGKMVIPVGGPFMVQQLMLVEKTGDGKIKTRQLLPVAFVPLTGGH
jgi:protein-L-isoaspartate(D-aspartate) O-methyltransferase